jgi:hypothetical protein
MAPLPKSWSHRRESRMGSRPELGATNCLPLPHSLGLFFLYKNVCRGDVIPNWRAKGESYLTLPQKIARLLHE